MTRERTQASDGGDGGAGVGSDDGHATVVPKDPLRHLEVPGRARGPLETARDAWRIPFSREPGATPFPAPIQNEDPTIAVPAPPWAEGARRRLQPRVGCRGTSRAPHAEPLEHACGSPRHLP